MVSSVEVNINTQSDPAQSGPQPSPDSVVYTSLIQTYLNLLNYDNATFLAERYAASCPSENAIYLLAYCYYRKGNAKAARSILLTRWSGRNNFEDNDAELTHIRNSARYLLATCCYDLALYAEAEEALLRHVREQFGRDVGGSGKIRGDINEVMDTWILQTDVSNIAVISIL